MANIEAKVEELITKTINDLGYKVYDVIYAKEGKDNYLRIFIDNSTGISLEDCEKVNNSITDMLDESNIIKEQYFLEISSPGIERHIRKDEHLKECIGEEINIKLYNKLPVLESKEIAGILISFDDKYIKIKNNEKEIEIDKSNIATMHKLYNW